MNTRSVSDFNALKRRNIFQQFLTGDFLGGAMLTEEGRFLVGKLP
jgi:hypothetical protein